MRWTLGRRAARCGVDDLRRGRRHLRVSVEDAHASPLCSLGIEGFCASMGLAQVPAISGRLAGWLMRIEPQLGFVIDAAWQRHMHDLYARESQRPPSLH